jgi:serine/threonine protein kinase
VGGTERFGRYRLIRRLAQGGMAEIWLAHEQSQPNRDLVIKRIHPHLASDTQFVMMFLDEARIAARLDHPGCVTIFDLGRHEDSYYLAMEYIHGEDIRAIARQARKKGVPLPRKLAVEIIAGAAEGLHYAHDLKDATGRPLNVVHRDVSPQNILVTYDGRVKIVDFGIAKAADQANRTQAGVLKGKYAYMSPEQVLGGEIDRRADVFALGVLLYELTTGKRLFKAATELETMRRITKGDITPPTVASPGYPAKLEAIVLEALASDKGERYESADALQRELRRFLAEHNSSVSPEDVSAFMKDLFSDRLEAERAAHAQGDRAAFLQARFGDEDRGPASGADSEPSREIEDIDVDLDLSGDDDGELEEDDFPDTPSGVGAGLRTELDIGTDGDPLADDGFDIGGDESGLHIDTGVPTHSEVSTMDTGIREMPTDPMGALGPRTLPGDEPSAADRTIPGQPALVVPPPKRGMRNSLWIVVVLLFAAAGAGALLLPYWDEAGAVEGETSFAPTPLAQAAGEPTEEALVEADPSEAQPEAAEAAPPEVAEAEGETEADAAPETGAVAVVEAGAGDPADDADPADEADADAVEDEAPDRRVAKAQAPATPRRPPRRAPRPQVGWVTITADAPGTAHLGGESLGALPLERHALPPGTHTIQIRGEDVERRVRVQVAAGRAVNRSVSLKTGTLRVRVSPWAELYLDGRHLGTTPLAPLRVPSGRHTLEAYNPDLDVRRRVPFQMDPDGEVLLTIDLQDGG